MKRIEKNALSQKRISEAAMRAYFDCRLRFFTENRELLLIRPMKKTASKNMAAGESVNTPV